MIPPDTQRRMAERAGATITEVAGSHVSMVSHPQVDDRRDPGRRRGRRRLTRAGGVAALSPAATATGWNGRSSRYPPARTVTAVPAGISCHRPGRSENGSETIMRSPSVRRWMRGFSGCSLRSDSASAEANSDRAGPSLA